MYRLAEGIGLSVEVSDSGGNFHFEVVESDRAFVQVGIFLRLDGGRDHHICAT